MNKNSTKSDTTNRLFEIGLSYLPRCRRNSTDFLVKSFEIVMILRYAIQDTIVVILHEVRRDSAVTSRTIDLMRPAKENDHVDDRHHDKVAQVHHLLRFKKYTRKQS